MSQILKFVREGAGVWFHQRATTASEETVKQYYENLNRSTLSKELVDVLGKLLDSHDYPRGIFKQHAATDEDGVLFWEEDSFKKWVTTNQQLVILSAFVPTLWRTFVYFARYPFTEELILNSSNGPALHHQCIDEDGFVLAYNLLGLRGVELVGSTKDAWTPGGSIEKSWSQKYPRLASLAFNSLRIFSTEGNERFQELDFANLTENSEKQVMDAIALTQPEPYMSGLSFEPNLREAARRLLADNAAPNYENNSSFTVSKDDLQTLVQLFLLLRIGSAPWRRGLILHYNVKRSGDVENPALVYDEEEIFLSARLANSLIQHSLGNVDSITWQSFETVYKTYPNIVLRFYELWTAICVVNPPNASLQNLDSRLSNCVVQSLSLIGPVEFDSLVPGGSLFNEDERQLQLDLQNATLVTDSTSTVAIDESKLIERLTNTDWFHILILSTEETLQTGSTESTERLINLFTSPPEKQIWFEDTPGGATYSWRYGFVQLMPHISTSQTGGLSASFQDDAIKFFPHSDPSHESSAVTVDLKNGTVVVELTGRSLQRLKLKSLKCYQMPGTATTFTKPAEG